MFSQDRQYSVYGWRTVVSRTSRSTAGQLASQRGSIAAACFAAAPLLQRLHGAARRPVGSWIPILVESGTCSMYIWLRDRILVYIVKYSSTTVRTAVLARSSTS